MSGRTWLTVETPPLLSDTTERQSGISAGRLKSSAACFYAREGCLILTTLSSGFQAAPYLRPRHEQPGKYPEGEERADRGGAAAVESRFHSVCCSKLHHSLSTKDSQARLFFSFFLFFFFLTDSSHCLTTRADMTLPQLG